MENRTKLILLICTLLIFNFLVVSFIIYQNILYPAYLSTEHSCRIITDEELHSLGYFTGGFVSNGEVTYITEFEVDEKVIRHESLHVWFYEHGLSHSCDYKFFRYVEEVIAYTYQYL